MSKYLVKDKLAAALPTIWPSITAAETSQRRYQKPKRPRPIIGLSSSSRK